MVEQLRRFFEPLRNCGGCAKSIVPGLRGELTGVKATDGDWWHIGCWNRRPLPPSTRPAAISDLYDVQPD